jgi:hypothetical protein
VDKEFTRREIIGAGLGVAAVALAGAAISTTAAAQGAPASNAGANAAAGLSEFNKYGEELKTAWS